MIDNTEEKELTELKYSKTSLIRIFPIVRHFKGNFYCVIEDPVLDSENQEDIESAMTAYVPLYVKDGLARKLSSVTRVPQMYVRKRNMFLECVDRPEYNYSGPRFRPVDLENHNGVRKVLKLANEMCKFVSTLCEVIDDHIIKLQSEIIEDVLLMAQNGKLPEDFSTTDAWNDMLNRIREYEIARSYREPQNEE